MFQHRPARRACAQVYLNYTNIFSLWTAWEAQLKEGNDQKTAIQQKFKVKMQEQSVGSSFLFFFSFKMALLLFERVLTNVDLPKQCSISSVSCERFSDATDSVLRLTEPSWATTRSRVRWSAAQPSRRSALTSWWARADSASCGAPSWAPCPTTSCTTRTAPSSSRVSRSRHAVAAAVAFRLGADVFRFWVRSENVTETGSSVAGFDLPKL